MCTCSEGVTRRQAMQAAAAMAAAFAAGALPLGWTRAADDKKQKVLFFTKSAGFQHSVITRKGDALGHAEKILIELGKEHGFDVTATKDGSIFTPEKLKEFDVIAFYTTGDPSEYLRMAAGLSPVVRRLSLIHSAASVIRHPTLSTHTYPRGAEHHVHLQ